MFADDGMQDRRFAASGRTEKGVSEARYFCNNDNNLKNNFPLSAYLKSDCIIYYLLVIYIIYLFSLIGRFAKKEIYRDLNVVFTYMVPR